jgi:hypothetical protein
MHGMGMEMVDVMGSNSETAKEQHNIAIRYLTIYI